MNLRDLEVISHPFPILVFEDVFDPALVRAAYESWPHLGWDNWHRYNDKNSIKYGSKDGRQAPPPCLALLDMMSQFPLDDFIGPLRMEKVPYFPDMSYHAGGLHCIQPGGHLGCHIDALSHPLHPWNRVANLLLYINPEWRQSWGGQLTLHDESRQECKYVFPRFNRLVIFQPTDLALHSVSPIQSNALSRRVLASFFWQRAIGTEQNTTAEF